MATRTAASDPIERKHAVNWPSMESESALRRSGRLRVTTAVEPSRSSTMSSKVMVLTSSVDALGMPFPLLLAQDELLDLSGGGLWQGPELDLPGCLEMGETGLAMLDDLLGRRLFPGREGHEGLRHLAPLLVGNRDHRRLEDRGMADHRLLHLDGADVLPAGDDDVLLPVAQLDCPVRMAHAEIAAVEPAALERLRGRLGIAEVAQHDDVAAHDHFAHRLSVGRDVVHLVVDDADFSGGDVGESLPCPARGALRRIEGLLARPPNGDGEGPVDLGEPVHV